MKMKFLGQTWYRVYLAFYTVCVGLYVKQCNGIWKVFSKAENEINQYDAKDVCYRYFKGIHSAGCLSDKRHRNMTEAEMKEWVNNSTQILKKIMYNHDPDVAPVAPGHPVEIGLMFEVLSLGEVNEVNMEFTTDIYFYQYWKDYRLAVGQDRNISVTGNALNKLWKPDTYFVNAKNPRIHEVLQANRMMIISTEGDVKYMARVSLTSHCTVELRRYPFDTQYCDMVIESFSLTEDKLIYKWKKDVNVTIFDDEMAQFEFDKIELLNHHTKLASPAFSDAFARFHFKRRTSYITLQVYFPSLLITLLSFVVFWIPKSAVPARVTLSVTSVLTIIYFEKAVDAKMPNIAYVKAIDYHLYASLMFIFFTLLEYAFVLNINIKKQPTLKPKICKEPDDIEMQKRTSSQELNCSIQEMPRKSSVTRKISFRRWRSLEWEYIVDNVHVVDRICRLLFPILYCLFALVYWIIWLA